MHTHLAWVYQSLGDHQSAVTHYRLALKLDPKNSNLHRALGLALSDNGDINGAIAELLTTTKLTPSDEKAKLCLQSLMQRKNHNN